MDATFFFTLQVPFSPVPISPFPADFRSLKGQIPADRVQQLLTTNHKLKQRTTSVLFYPGPKICFPILDFTLTHHPSPITLPN